MPDNYGVPRNSRYDPAKQVPVEPRTDVADPLMSRDEVATLLGIAPEAVRSTLRRHGIRELRGYPREAVQAIERPGQGRRTDLTERTQN